MGRNGKSLMGIPWEWELVTKLEWEWEGMGIDCTGMGGSGNVKSHSRASLIVTTALDELVQRQ